MPVEVESSEGVVRIKVSGRFDFNVHQEFRNGYESEGQPGGIFEIDLGGTDYMDSSALGMLLVMREWAGGAGSKISLVNCSGEIRKLLEIANYEKLFEIREAVS